MFPRKLKTAGFILTLVCIQISMLVFAPQGWGADQLTPLAVTQKAMGKLFGLMNEQKISPNWPAGFSGATVSLRNVKGFPEYMLQFSSSSGSPGTVILYYTIGGDYIASNVDG